MPKVAYDFASPVARLRFLVRGKITQYAERAVWNLNRRISGRVAVDGTVYNIRPDTADWSVANEWHEPQTHAWIDQHFSTPGGTMIDVGGYSGSFSLRHRHQFERILAYEPFPENHRTFEKNIADNGAGGIIRLSNAAVSDRNGESVLYDGGISGHSLVDTGGGQISISTVRLDDEVEPDDTASVRLIKIDVEGSEIAVLSGARRLLCEGTAALILEANTPEEMRAQMQFLSPLGYDLHAALDGRNFVFMK